MECLGSTKMPHFALVLYCFMKHLRLTVFLEEFSPGVGVLEDATPMEGSSVHTPPVGLPAVPPTNLTLPELEHRDVQMPVHSTSATFTPGSPGFTMPPVVASPATYTGLLSIPIPVRIALCGHSILFWAHRRASSSAPGTQLQLSATATVHWVARRGMLWDAFLPSVCRIMSSMDWPHILLIHLGENDLVQSPGVDLLLKVTRDLTWLLNSYPRLIIVWSDMLVRRVWRGAIHPNRIDRSRKWVNRKIRALVLSLGGAFIPHDRIRFHAPHLFRGDGVHLSDQGCDLFLEDIMKGLRVLLSSLGGVDQA
ncbi:uncharacterized protein LOC133383184 isoform X2 [Rhineura floridana]|nr:uncharacterized protein LOC133383184 isoform X2 [Rhineura floridana]